jgi:hypothetical protein
LTRSPGAPDHHVRGVVHDYWIERREKLEKRRRRRASKAASVQAHKPIDKPIDLWDKVI